MGHPSRTTKKKMEQRVVITGIGAITPVGNHVADTWKNLQPYKVQLKKYEYRKPKLAFREAKRLYNSFKNQ